MGCRVGVGMTYMFKHKSKQNKRKPNLQVETSRCIDKFSSMIQSYNIMSAWLYLVWHSLSTSNLACLMPSDNFQLTCDPSVSSSEALFLSVQVSHQKCETWCLMLYTRVATALNKCLILLVISFFHFSSTRNNILHRIHSEIKGNVS